MKIGNVGTKQAQNFLLFLVQTFENKKQVECKATTFLLKVKIENQNRKCFLYQTEP